MATRPAGAQFIPVYVRSGKFVTADQFITANQAKVNDVYWGSLGIDTRKGEWRLIQEGAGTPAAQGLWADNTSARAIREHLASLAYLLQE